MRLLETVTNWIIVLCVLVMILCFAMAISSTATYLVLHGNPWSWQNDKSFTYCNHLDLDTIRNGRVCQRYPSDHGRRLSLRSNHWLVRKKGCLFQTFPIAGQQLRGGPAGIFCLFLRFSQDWGGHEPIYIVYLTKIERWNYAFDYCCSRVAFWMCCYHQSNCETPIPGGTYSVRIYERMDKNILKGVDRLKFLL